MSTEANKAMPTFDPIQYKQTTCQQWQAAAQAWNQWGPTIEQWLGPATEIMLDMADVRTGSRVLDVAAGAGTVTDGSQARWPDRLCGSHRHLL